MSTRQERMESYVSATEFSPLEEVLESEPAEEVVSTATADKVPDEGSDEVFSDKIPEGKSKKRVRTDAEIASPAKKKAKTPGTAPTKKTAKSANRKTVKAKRNPELKNYGEIEENCIVCVTEKPTNKTNVGTVRKDGHVWLSLCEDFFEILKDDKVMEEVKEVIMRAKTKKDDEKENENEKDVSADCGTCSGKFKGSQFSMICISCNRWIHLKCTQYTKGKEAEKNKKTFLCKQCLVQKDCHNNKESKIGNEEENSDDSEDTNKSKTENIPCKPVMPTSQRINTLKLNINALTRTSWLHDCHIKIAMEDIQKYEENKGESALYFGPAISHLIKLAPQVEVETHLSQCNVIFKSHIAFVVNDCKGDLGSGEGSHWSLLVYGRDTNTWYHMDSGNSANAPHAKLIMDKVNGFLVNQGSLENSSTSYVESRCTQQNNSYDCGPLTILFAHNTANMINRGEPLDTCLVDDKETYIVRTWIHNELQNKLLDLEKGEVRTSDTKNYSDKDDIVKSKKICWFHKYRTCKFGENCTYWHPTACKNIHKYGECRDNKCKLIHQNTCTAYCKQGKCTRKNCWFIHPLHLPRLDKVRQKERRDGLMYGTNKRRDDNHFGHNKFAGSNSTYSSQSRGQPNTNANRYKDVAHYGDREFFRRDWPTPMEEKLLRTIREVMRTESGGWGPAGW